MKTLTIALILMLFVINFIITTTTQVILDDNIHFTSQFFVLLFSTLLSMACSAIFIVDISEEK